MVFLFYKFLFFLSDFLEIQRKSFYLFLNELLSQEFTKIQPLWFRQNPVYKTGNSFGTSAKRRRPQEGSPELGLQPSASSGAERRTSFRRLRPEGAAGLTPEGLLDLPISPTGLAGAQGSPRASDFSSAPGLAEPSGRRSQPTEERSSAGAHREARKPPRRNVLQSRKSQRAYPVAKTPKLLKKLQPSSSGQPLGSQGPLSPRRGTLRAGTNDGAEGLSLLAPGAQGLDRQPKVGDALDLYNNAASIPPKDHHIVDFSYKTLTNEIYRQNGSSRGERGESAIQKIPPITANDRITTIDFLSKNYKFIKPALNIEESILFSKTYCCHFYMPVKLLDHSTNFTEMKWIFLGTLPLLTRRGHFIINGTPRIILNQIIRSSGIYFHKETTEEKKNSRLFYAEIISKSGPWVRLEVDPKKRIWVSCQQIGRSRISLSHFFQNFYQKYLDHHIFLNEKKKKWNFDAILLNEFFLDGSRSFKEPQNKIEANPPIYPNNLRMECNEATMFLGNQKRRVWTSRSDVPNNKSIAKRPLRRLAKLEDASPASAFSPEGQRKRKAEAARPFSLRCSFYFQFKKLWPKFKQLKIYSDDLSQNLYQLFSYKKYQIFNWSMFIYLKLKFSQKFTEIYRHPGFGLASLRFASAAPEGAPPGGWAPAGQRAKRPSTRLSPKGEQAAQVRPEGQGVMVPQTQRQIQNNQWLKKTRLKRGVSEEGGWHFAFGEGSHSPNPETAGGFAFGGRYENSSEPTTMLRRKSSMTTAQVVFPRTRFKLGFDILFASSSKNIGSSGGFHLDRSGRIRLNKRLGLSLKTLTLTPIDFLAISDILYRFVQGGNVDGNNPNPRASLRDAPLGRKRLDDIDDLKNRRLKTIGELLQNQLARGIQRLQKTFENTVQKDWIKFLNYQTYHSSLSFLNSFNLNRKKLALADQSLLERSFSYSPSLKYTDNPTIYSIPERGSRKERVPLDRQKSFFKDKSLPIPVDQILKYYFAKRRGPSMSVEIATSAAWRRPFPPKGRLPAKRHTPPVASSLGDVSLTNPVERLWKWPYGPTRGAAPRSGTAGQLFNFWKKGHGIQKTNTFDLLSNPNLFKKRIFEKRNFYLQQIRKFNIFTNREVAQPPFFGYRLPFLTSRISQNQLYSLLTKWHFKRNFVWKELLLYQKTAITGLGDALAFSPWLKEGGLEAFPKAKSVTNPPAPNGAISRRLAPSRQRESQGEHEPYPGRKAKPDRVPIDRPFFRPSDPDGIRKGTAVRPFHPKIQKPTASQVFFSTSILSIVNSLPINSTFKEFFHSHQLSQFLDQSNPLAEITHKRRLSCLGSGGITRETAGMEIRGIHLSHYGRICPIETPEGKNAGLVNSLTTTVNVNNQGFLETPYIEVYKQHYQNQKKLMFFSVEDQEIKNVFLNPKLPKLRNISVGIIKPQTQNFYKLSLKALNLVAWNPQQFLSIATTCIPFIEHDDANRALMGSNMQRQALPLIYLEQPIVTTVNAFRVLSDLKDIPTTSESGIILYVSQQKVSYYPLKKNDLVFSPSLFRKRQRYFGQSLFCDHAIRPKKHSELLGSLRELPLEFAKRSACTASTGSACRVPIYPQVPHLSQLPGGKLALVALGPRLSPYISFKKRGSQFGVNVKIDRSKVPLKLTIFNRSMSKQFFIQQFNTLKIDLKIQYNYKIFRIFFPFTSFSQLEKKKLTKQNINFFKIHSKF